MRYAAKLLIPSRCLAVINGYLNAEREGEFQGEDNTIIHTVSFPDGKFMDIKCCGCQDESSWTEAVLFAKANDGGFSQVTYIYRTRRVLPGRVGAGGRRQQLFRGGRRWRRHREPRACNHLSRRSHFPGLAG